MPKTAFKNALFGCFWAGTLKHYCHILNQRLLICLTAKFRTKRKFLNLETTMPVILKAVSKNYCYI